MLHREAQGEIRRAGIGFRILQKTEGKDCGDSRWEHGPDLKPRARAQTNVTEMTRSSNWAAMKKILVRNECHQTFTDLWTSCGLLENALEIHHRIVFCRLKSHKTGFCFHRHAVAATQKHKLDCFVFFNAAILSMSGDCADVQRLGRVFGVPAVNGPKGRRSCCHPRRPLTQFKTISGCDMIL